MTGARVPEKEITGISNLPDFDKIVDALSWDVKARVLGDKDPRSARWSPLTLVRTGLLVQKAALIVSLAPTAGGRGDPGATAERAGRGARWLTSGRAWRGRRS